MECLTGLDYRGVFRTRRQVRILLKYWLKSRNYGRNPKLKYIANVQFPWSELMNLRQLIESRSYLVGKIQTYHSINMSSM